VRKLKTCQARHQPGIEGVSFIARRLFARFWLSVTKFLTVGKNVTEAQPHPTAE
jgi:hypothetical protein